MKKFLLGLIAALAIGLAQTAQGQTTLSVGDIRIIGANSTAPDGFAFVLLRDIDANTVLKFTDNGFLSSDATGVNQFRGGENFASIQFNANASAGTVIRLTNSSGLTTDVTASSNYTGTWSNSGGTPNVYDALSGISSSGDQIFIYQGSGFGPASTPANVNVTANTNPATFSGSLIYGMNFATNTNWLTSGTPTSNNSYLPSLLNVTDANITFGSTATSQVYTGTRLGLTVSVAGAATANTTNFTSYVTNQTLSVDPFVFESSANLHWDANGNTAGDGGAGTWDASTNNRFKNSASGTTFFRWVNSSAGNDHTAVFGGTAGTVTVSGTVVTNGLQFTTTGYTLTGGTINLFSASNTITADSGVSATINSVISGNALVKAGTGTVSLGGTNTYTGTTTVSAGTLNINGNHSAATGSITVGNTGTLGGTGTLGSATTVQSGGTIRGDSGTGTGSLTIGNLTIGNNATLATQVTTNQAVNSKLLVQSAAATINLDSTAGKFKIQLLNDSVLTYEQLYTITLIEGNANTIYQRNGSAWDAGTNPFTTADFDLIGQGYSVFNTVSLSVEGNNLVLIFAPVPEPTTILGASMLGLAGFALIRRRKKSVAAQA